MELAVENEDLVWKLDSFNKRKRAIRFALGFENRICIYSEAKQELYTNYNLFPLRDDQNQLIVLPNPYARRETYHGLPASAVTATGLHIIGGDMVGKQGLVLLIPFKGDGSRTRYRAVPLQVGLGAINRQRPDNRPLLPVLKKGDLRELESQTPCLHLHCLHLDRLGHLTPLERQGIQRAILERLSKIS